MAEEGGGRRLVLGPDDALFVETAASTHKFCLSGGETESAGPVRVLISGDDDDDTTTLDYYVITLFDRQRERSDLSMKMAARFYMIIPLPVQMPPCLNLCL